MKTPLDEYHERKGMKAKPHERIPTGAGTGCKGCGFSPGHPVHNHQAEVISIFSKRSR